MTGDWWHRASCIEERDLFDRALDGTTRAVRMHARERAKQVCRVRCPVIAECLADMLRRGDDTELVDGSVRAGLTTREFTKLKRRKGAR
jgi:hypothetical protein